MNKKSKNAVAKSPKDAWSFFKNLIEDKLSEISHDAGSWQQNSEDRDIDFGNSKNEVRESMMIYIQDIDEAVDTLQSLLSDLKRQTNELKDVADSLTR